MSLEGKTVLITGSSRGIGKDIAMEFAKKGCNIVLNASKSSDELVKVQEELKENGYYSYSYLADVSDYSACETMFNKILSLYGMVDILVNNAGISSIGLFTKMSPDDWDKVIKTNLYSVFNCTHIALKRMIETHSGSIINISSIWGDRGASCEAVYSASKGAINSFTKAIAKEAGPSNIRVNAIGCGVIDTSMNNSLGKEEKEVLKNEISLMRFGSVNEIAKLVLFLASDDSSYINGQVITADGCMF